MIPFLKNTFRISSLIILTVIALPISGCSRADNTPDSEAAVRSREPAHYLPASMSGILFRKDRDEIERPEETIDAMNLEKGDLVADIGSGPGYYSLRLAQRVGPDGVVFAVDIQQEMLDQLAERMKKAGIRNIYPVLGDFTDPHLPKGKIDWVLLVDAYHEFSEPEKMLEHILASLTPDGRVALLEYRAEQEDDRMPKMIPRDHKMTVDEVMEEWTAAGFELVELLEHKPAQHYFIFKRAEKRESFWKRLFP